MLQLHNQPSSGLWFSEGFAHITGIILGDTHLILGRNKITNHMKFFFLAAIKDGDEMTVSCQIRFPASTWGPPKHRIQFGQFAAAESVNASLRVLTFPILSTFRQLVTRLRYKPSTSDPSAGIRRWTHGTCRESDRRRDVVLFLSGWEGFRCSDAQMNFMVSPDLESEIPPKKYEISWEQSQFEGIPNLEEHRNHLSWFRMCLLGG